MLPGWSAQHRTRHRWAYGRQIFENLVVAEIYKTLLHRAETPAMYFWRTSAGNKVDLVLETQSGLVLIEIKASSTPRPDMAKEISRFSELFKGRVFASYVIHAGQQTLPLGGDVLAIPFAVL